MTVEPQKILLDAAMEAMGGAGRELRQRGWDVNLVADYIHDRGTYRVQLTYVLPQILIPIEAKP